MNKIANKKSTLIISMLAVSLFLVSSCKNLFSVFSDDESSTIVSFVATDDETEFNRSFSHQRTALPVMNLHENAYTYSLSLTDDSTGKTEELLTKGSYEDFINLRKKLLRGQIYQFDVTVWEGEDERFTGATQTKMTGESLEVGILLLPCSNGKGSLNVSWSFPNDGVIEKLLVGLGSKTGQASLSEVDIATLVDGSNKRAANKVFQNLDAGVEQWLTYECRDNQDSVVYEGSESVFIVGKKVSTVAVEIEQRDYYRIPVSISLQKDGEPWDDGDLALKLVIAVEEDGIRKEYILESVGDGSFSGYVPEGEYQIHIAKEDLDNDTIVDFIDTGIKFDTNNSEGDEHATLEFETLTPQEGVILTPVSGVIGTSKEDDVTSLIVPKNVDFKVAVDVVEPGYKADGSTIEVGGKTVVPGNELTLNSKDLNGQIDVNGVSAEVYTITYVLGREDSTQIQFNKTVTREYTIQDEVTLPSYSDFADSFKIDTKKMDGWIETRDASGQIVSKFGPGDTGDLILIPYWKENGSAQYIVRYWFEKADDAGKYETKTEYKDDTSHSGQIGSITNITEGSVPVVQGFALKQIENKKILDDENPENRTVVNVYYDRNIINITLKGNGGKWGSDSQITLSGKYGFTVTAPSQKLLREHYEFVYWYEDDDEEKIHHILPAKFPLSDITYTAVWKQNVSDYKVQYWTEKTDSSDFEKNGQPLTLNGVIGEKPLVNINPLTVFASENDQKGFIYSKTEPADTIIASDGSTVINVYFTRRTVGITLAGKGGTWASGTKTEYIINGKYGASLPQNIEEPDRGSDWSFIGWTKEGEDSIRELPLVFSSGNEIYNANWNQINAKYTILTQTENANGKYIESSQEFTGRIGDRVVPEAPVLDGFMDPVVTPIESIQADGNSVAIVKYTRKTIRITFDPNGGKWVEPETGIREGLYGAEYERPVQKITNQDGSSTTVLEKSHFVFLGWALTSDAGYNNLVTPQTTFTQDVTYYAVWMSKVSGGIVNTSDKKISLNASVDGTRITANTVIPYTSDWEYVWIVNEQRDSTSQKTLVLNNCSKKIYQLTVIATDKKSGNTFTATKEVSVK